MGRRVVLWSVGEGTVKMVGEGFQTDWSASLESLKSLAFCELLDGLEGLLFPPKFEV